MHQLAHLKPRGLAGNFQGGNRAQTVRGGRERRNKARSVAGWMGTDDPVATRSKTRELRRLRKEEP